MPDCKDYGTPAAVSDQLVTVEIDGRSVTVPDGTSVMRAAEMLDTSIPKLCATDRLERPTRDEDAACHPRRTHARSPESGGPFSRAIDIPRIEALLAKPGVFGFLFLGLLVVFLLVLLVPG